MSKDRGTSLQGIPLTKDGMTEASQRMPGVYTSERHQKTKTKKDGIHKHIEYIKLNDVILTLTEDNRVTEVNSHPLELLLSKKKKVLVRMWRN